MSSLPSVTRIAEGKRALELRLEGLNTVEIAESMGLSKATVARRLAYAFKTQLTAEPVVVHRDICEKRLDQSRVQLLALYDSLHADDGRIPRGNLSMAVRIIGELRAVEDSRVRLLGLGVSVRTYLDAELSLKQGTQAALTAV